MQAIPMLLAATFVYLSISELSWGQMIIGHRGASHDAPENTLSAFREAWEQGADGVEGDFYFTRDQQVVCIHDRDTQRTSGTRLMVATSTLAELRSLEYGAWKAPRFRGEPLPTLQDVLSVVPNNKKLVIELKSGPGIVPLVQRILEQSQIDPEHVLIISFDEAVVRSAKTHMPHIRAHWLTGYKQDLLSRKWQPGADEIAATLKRCQADGLGTKAEREVVTPDFIRVLQSRGMQEFHVWTVDSPEDARYFRDLGAMAITTNRPEFIRQALEDAPSE